MVWIWIGLDMGWDKVRQGSVELNWVGLGELDTGILEHRRGKDAD